MVLLQTPHQKLFSFMLPLSCDGAKGFDGQVGCEGGDTGEARDVGVHLRRQPLAQRGGQQLQALPGGVPGGWEREGTAVGRWSSRQVTCSWQALVGVQVVLAVLRILVPHSWGLLVACTLRHTMVCPS